MKFGGESPGPDISSVNPDMGDILSGKSPLGSSEPGSEGEIPISDVDLPPDDHQPGPHSIFGKRGRKNRERIQNWRRPWKTDEDLYKLAEIAKINKKSGLRLPWDQEEALKELDRRQSRRK